MAHRIIFDTDPGVDDATALAFASRHPEIEILGVTTVFGNASIDTVTRNALYLKRLLGLHAPVAKGAGRSVQRPNGPPPAHVHGSNGLGDVRLVDVGLPALDPRPAHRMMSDIIRAYPGEVTLVAVGRMTNLATLLDHDPDAAALVRRVVIMGGAFGTSGTGKGNVTPYAEANIFGDPEAADRVFAAPWEMSAVGLDVTRQVQLSPEDFERLSAQGGDIGRFLAEISKVYVGYHAQFGVDGCYVHDSSAVACLLAPELFDLRSGPIRVTTEGERAGQTVQRAEPTHHHPVQRAAVGVDADGVRRLLLETLCDSTRT